MSQEQAEAFLETMARGMGLDTRIHRWEIYLHTDALRYRAVEMVGATENTFVILVEELHGEDWKKVGFISGYLSFPPC
jgi:hypothetical protein